MQHNDMAEATPALGNTNTVASEAATTSTLDLSCNAFNAPAHLPTEIILLVLIHLDHLTLLNAAATCRRWYALTQRYRQFLWRHLAWRDFSFTAARGLWKLEFLKDRDLRLCFPLSAMLAESADCNDLSSHTSGDKERLRRCSLCTSCTARHRDDASQLGTATSASTSSRIGPNLGTDTEHDSIAECESGPGQYGDGDKISATSSNTCTCVRLADPKGKRRADALYQHQPDHEEDSLNTLDAINHEGEDWILGDQEQDWRALYRLTSNWYRGRAKGYCPLMLPSLTTLTSATQTLSESPSVSSSSAGTRSSSRSRSTSGRILSTPAHRAIRRILGKRRPMAVVGLQHEGSALTALSLASFPTRHLDSTGCSDEMMRTGSRPKSRQAALIRSNPHYRDKLPSGAEHGVGSQTNRQTPNIMAQDPEEHDRVVFAIRTASALKFNKDSSNNIGGGGDESGSTANATTTITEQLQHDDQLNPQGFPSSLETLLSPPLGHQMSEDSANDILCHYSSPLHSFLVTGHMDGGVRLWDMSIQEPGQQCIRHWQTGARRRVLCVGMNSRVVVCGNADSTLCVWDIHPDPNSSLSSHGTIHSASYLASTATPGLDEWVSGIEHICVGDSLVACSTEFSGSVLVFSLATGSLVYEIPGLYQPSKMCMTDFFLLTGGRGPWNQGGSMMTRLSQQNGQHEHEDAGHDEDVAGQQRWRDGIAMDSDDNMSCCINVWDLRTGDRLYSLTPRLPMHHLQQTRNIVSILSDPQPSNVRHWKTRSSNTEHYIRTATRSPDITTIQHNMGSTDSGHTSFASSRQQRGSIKSRLHTSQSPQSPISAPLTLLDITVTPDHTTLVATLCERSHEGREGVYCWDFNGSRLQGYHEQGAEMSTMIIDKYDIDYEEGEHGGSNDEILDQEISQNDEDETDEWSGDSGCEGRFNNNMVMQQVDASVFRNMHQARITGKVWIGWRLDENEFRRLKVAYRRRTLERRRRRKEMGIESLTDASLVRPDIADSMVHVSLR